MLKHAAILAGVLAVFLFLVRGIVIFGPYGYDEADYMYAVSKGFAANATDNPTLPLPELVKIGLGRGRDPAQRIELSEEIRNHDDMVFYRHWHGPLYVYWLRIMKPLAPTEQAMRAWSYMFPVAAALLLYFGALWLVDGAAGKIAAILGAVLFLWSYPVVSPNELAPHELYVFWTVATLLLLSRLLVATERPSRYWYAALACSALAFCTLEIAFVLIATVLICGHAVRDRLKPGLAFAAKSAAAFVVPVLLIWPAAIFKFSFIKAYLFMGYLALFRKGAWGSDISVAGTWWLRFVTTPVPWVLLAAAVFLLIRRRKDAWSPALLPFTIYAVSAFLAIFRVNSEFPRYVLPLFPAIVLLAAFTLGRFLNGFAVALICVAMFVTTYPQIRALPRRADPNAYAMLDLVRRNDLDRKRLLVPAGAVPMLHCYFPESHLRPYRDESEIAADVSRAPVDGVIYGGNPPRYVPQSPDR